MKHPRQQASRAGWVPAAISLLLTVSGTPVVQAAEDAAPVVAAKPSVAASPPARPASAPMSPHARAARQRALAQADTAASGIRVSPLTDRRKPHKPAGGR